MVTIVIPECKDLGWQTSPIGPHPAGSSDTSGLVTSLLASGRAGKT
jgi:hypothetical protein